MTSKAGFASGVIDMLKEDHQKVQGLFEEYESAEGNQRAEIAATAIMELEIHAELEEKIIYPAIRQEIEEDDLMNEAVEEHHLVHVLIKELKKLKSSDERFQAKFTVLGELVKHHIKEEEDEMLPKAEKSDIDWEALETTVMKRKEALVSKGMPAGTKKTVSKRRG
jgi:hemerythrin superfamily protein